MNRYRILKYANRKGDVSTDIDLISKRRSDRACERERERESERGSDRTKLTQQPLASASRINSAFTTRQTIGTNLIYI